MLGERFAWTGGSSLPVKLDQCAGYSDTNNYLTISLCLNLFQVNYVPRFARDIMSNLSINLQSLCLHFLPQNTHLRSNGSKRLEGGVGGFDGEIIIA